MELLLVAVAGLAVIIGATLFSRRTGIAAPLLLVVLGIVASVVPGMPAVEVEPEWILAGVLPPLLYASSVRLPVMDFRRNIVMIGWLSVVVVVVSAVLVGFLVHLMVPEIPLAAGVALGAVVSPTDAVAATSIGKRLGLPPRLMTVLEGESLVNDATALVLLRSALGAVAGTFAFWPTAGEFLRAVLVAIAVGAVVGYLTVRLRSRLDDPVLTTVVSFAVPFLAYFPSEELHGSGVLAVVVAGLLTGYLGARRFTARDRQTEATNWATVSFVLESALFLVMGLQLPGLLDAARADSTIAEVALLTVAILGVLVVARTAGVGLPQLVGRIRPGRAMRAREKLELITERIDGVPVTSDRDQSRVDSMRKRLMRGYADVVFLENEPITARGAVVLAWSGMRGAITVAAAQTIPESVPHRSTIVLVAFLVATATLIAFGASLPWVIRRAEFEERSPEERREEVTGLMQAIMEAATERIGPLQAQTIDGEPIDPGLAEQLSQRFAPMLVARGDQRPPPRPGVREQSMVVQRRYIDAMRQALNEERSIGVYRTATFSTAESILDGQERFLDARS